jgi:hypothetical protein
MNCQDCRAGFDAYAQGRLSEAAAAELEVHLAECAECAAALEALEPPLDAAARLPRAIDPGLDLWPGIRARLGTRGRRVTLSWWTLAAAAVLLVVASSGLTRWIITQRSPVARVAELPPIAPLEAQYFSAVNELGRALDGARTRLAPATLSVIERNLAVIDSALAESRRALQQDPGNPGLERLVITAWQHKMDFLRRAIALPAKS